MFSGSNLLRRECCGEPWRRQVYHPGNARQMSHPLVPLGHAVDRLRREKHLRESSGSSLLRGHAKVRFSLVKMRTHLTYLAQRDILRARPEMQNVLRDE